ncbi:hypothetical protein [Bradyrhizobium sp.]|uniref:hypothetical protein n=1 Tax=Bradyrhizobium sp. TaxID=376 RepID=UPI002D28E5A8|nr:hypothetical protein [Bradyrhizobium sp.]HZR76265.1 hypothetical protein [Bradyrhizobium sp.]
MNRQAVLSSLIQFNEPVTLLKVALEPFPWDSDKPLVTLTSRDIVAVLQRFAAGEFGAIVLEEWANLVECREDIEYEPDRRDAISDAIFQLANPTLHAPLVTQVPKIISSLR